MKTRNPIQLSAILTGALVFLSFLLSHPVQAQDSATPKASEPSTPTFAETVDWLKDKYEASGETSWKDKNANVTHTTSFAFIDCKAGIMTIRYKCINHTMGLSDVRFQNDYRIPL